MRLAPWIVATALLVPSLLAAAPAVRADCSTGCVRAASVDGPDPAGAAELLSLTNAVRAQAGLPAFEHRADMADVAVGHSQAMASAGDIFHNDAFFSSAMKTRLGITSAGENVGLAGSATGVHKALMASDLHRANILSGSFRVAGYGAVWKNGVLYVTQTFGVPRAGTTARPAPAPAPAPAAAPAPAPPKPAAAVAPKPPRPRPAASPAAPPTVPAAPTSTVPAPAPAPVPAPSAPPLAAPADGSADELAIAPRGEAAASTTPAGADGLAAVLLVAIGVLAVRRLRTNLIGAHAD